MKAFTTFALPGLAVAGALLLVSPGEDAVAFNKIGGSLGASQRDYRVFNNFSDLQSNNNTTPDPMYPGTNGTDLGAELAIRKGATEWGSGSYGDGSGDPTQSNLGDGGANFDFFFAGQASGAGGTNDNVVSVTPSCGGGTLAFTETPISNGWRIIFCDNWTWADGPANIGRQAFDIQGVACHEFGHALGLGHSGTGAATMAPSISSGNESARSIHSDDSNGIQCIYGVKGSAKPEICSTSVSGSQLTIKGFNFDSSSNEVWFTNGNVTSGGTSNPKVVVSGVGATLSGSQWTITLTIPANAAPGDVLVKIPGTSHATISNAFPTDLAGSFSTDSCGVFSITQVTPATIEALVPGTQPSLTIKGGQFSGVQKIYLNLFTEISPSRWTIVDDNTITIDMPQSPFLGPNSITLEKVPGEEVSTSIEIIEPVVPKLELGNGDPLNVVTSGSNMNVIVAGEVGETLRVYYSPSNVPSKHPAICFDMGNNFSQLFFAKSYSIGSSGWAQESFPVTVSGSGQTFYSQAANLNSPTPYEVSNLQSVVLSP